MGSRFVRSNRPYTQNKLVRLQPARPLTGRSLTVKAFFLKRTNSRFAHSDETASSARGLAPMPTQLESRAPGLYPGGFGAIPNVGSCHCPRHLEVRISVFHSEQIGSNPIGGTQIQQSLFTRGFKERDPERKRRAWHAVSARSADSRHGEARHGVPRGTAGPLHEGCELDAG